MRIYVGSNEPLKQLDKWARKHKTTRAAALRQAVDELVYTVPVRGTKPRK